MLYLSMFMKPTMKIEIRKQLVTKMYDREGVLRTLVREKITDTGMVVIGGAVYEDIAVDLLREIRVTVSKVISFPFEKVSPLEERTSRTKAVFGNKAVITATIKYVEAKKLGIMSKKTNVLLFYKKKTSKYGKEYGNHSSKVAYTCSFIPEYGLSNTYMEEMIVMRTMQNLLKIKFFLELKELYWISLSFLTNYFENGPTINGISHETCESKKEI